MVTTRETFVRMREDYLSSDLSEKTQHVIKHIEKRLLASIDCGNNNIVINVPDALWGKHNNNIRQLDILKAYITNQYRKAGWTHVAWRVEDSRSSYNTYSITLG